MRDNRKQSQGESTAPQAPRQLTPEARRALAEAEQRRRERDAQAQERQPAEKGGQAGPEPTRYGDWEKGGIASDF